MRLPPPHFLHLQYMRLLGYPAHKISILTTYNGQKALLRDVIERRCAQHPAFGRPAKVSAAGRSVVQPLHRHAAESSCFSIAAMHLHQRLSTACMGPKDKQQLTPLPMSYPPVPLPPPQVTTVDKYQGQQNDYVLLSLVRTNHFGHLRDVRRLGECGAEPTIRG